MSTFNINDYRLKKDEDDSEYTHQSMRGGKFVIPQECEKEFFYYSLQHPDLCLCERLPENFPLYFDIDGLKEENDAECDQDLNNIKDIVKFLKDNLEDYFVQKGNKVLTNAYVLYNKSKKGNYHVFFPDIIVNKKSARIICKLLNDLTNGTDGDELFDSNAYNSCLRMMGTGKYDRRKEVKLNTESQYIFDMDNCDFKDGTDLFEKSRCVSVRSRIGKPNTQFSKYFESELSKINTKNVRSILMGEDEPELLSADSSEEKLTKRDEYYLHELTKNNNDFLRKIMFECLKPFRSDDYSEWMRMVFIFKNTKLPRSILIEWSKRSEKYDESAIAQIDSIMANKKSNEHQAGFKQLLSFALEDNPTVFKSIYMGVSRYEFFDLRFSINNIRYYMGKSEKGLARLAHSILDKRIVCDPKRNNMIYYWDGDLWKPDSNNQIYIYISDILEKCLELLYQRQKYHEEQEQEFLTEEEVKLLKGLMQKVNTTSFIGNVRKWFCTLSTDFDILAKFDKNPDVLSVKNGIIELRTGVLRPREYSDYNTFCISTEYKGLEYNTDNIQQFFRDIMLDEEDVVKYLQKFLGYSITGNVTEQKFAIWNGNGSNGKSMTIELLQNLLEEDCYFATLNSAVLSAQIKGGEATTIYNALDGVRLSFVDESNKNQSLNEGVIKRFTGSKHLKMRGLYEEERMVGATWQICLATNYLPHITDDPALHRRLLNFPFSAKFVDAKKYDNDNKCHRMKLKESIIKERIQNDALLTWLVQGSVNWYATGLEDVPAKIQDFTSEYLYESDPLLEMFRVNLEKDDLAKMSLKYLREFYEELSGNAMTLKEFRKELKTKDITIIKEDKNEFVRYKKKVEKK